MAENETIVTKGLPTPAVTRSYPNSNAAVGTTGAPLQDATKTVASDPNFGSPVASRTL